MPSYLSGDDAAFWWQPESAGPVRVLRFLQPATNCDEQPVVVSDAAAALDRRVYRSSFAHCLAVRISIERFQSAEGFEERRLRSMLAHLARGGSVAFSTDHDRAWASRATTTPAADDNTVATAGNLFSSLTGGVAAIGTDDHMVLQSPNPTLKWEKVRSTGYNTGTGVISLGSDAGSRVAWTHAADTLVRWAYFYPFLVLPPGASVDGALTDEYHSSWTLDLTLWTQPDLEHAAIEAQE